MSEVFPLPPVISAQARTRRLGHSSACVWLTGLPASGKSTIARELSLLLHQDGRFVTVLDGDNLRSGLSSDLGFGLEDRRENLRRAASVASLLMGSGLIVVAAFVSPTESLRQVVHQILPAERLFECWVKCPLTLCESRDPKGLYRRARAGGLPEFTGVDAPYEPPQRPKLVLDTQCTGPRAAAVEIRSLLERAGVFSRPEP